MSDEYSMYGIEDILDYFNIERTYKLINEQLRDDDLSPSGTLPDHLKPMWVKYKEIHPDPKEGIDSSVMYAVNERFDTICRIFIDSIAKKYGITLDVGWFEDRSRDEIHTITLFMYTFFVLDLESNIKEVLYKYIVNHSEELASSFGEPIKNRKDSPFLTFKKSMPSDYAVVCATINDVCMWILDQMTEDEFFSYLDEDYIPLPLIKSLFEEGHMAGDFMGHIYNFFINNNTVRCRVIFDIISIIKNNHKKSEKEDD
jgi:hypothetical protein